MTFYIFLALLLVFSINLAFGESHLKNFEWDNSSVYKLDVDEHSFLISYEVDSKVIAMDIDNDLSSLLIGLKDTKDSVFKIDLEHELISDSNNEFVILVDGIEVDYDIVHDSDRSIFTFFVPEFSEEIEIIGTHVIPEFPLGYFIGFLVLISLTLTLPWLKIPIFKL